MLHSEGLEKRQGHRVLAVFGAFRLLLGGSTNVQHPFAKYEIYLTFSKSYSVYLFCFYVFNAWPLRIYILAFVCFYLISLNSAYFCPINSNWLFTFCKLIIICLNISVWPEIIGINTKIIINATAKLSTFFLSLPRKCYFYYSIIYQPLNNKNCCLINIRQQF